MMRPRDANTDAAPTGALAAAGASLHAAFDADDRQGDPISRNRSVNPAEPEDLTPCRASGPQRLAPRHRLRRPPIT